MKRAITGHACELASKRVRPRFERADGPLFSIMYRGPMRRQRKSRMRMISGIGIPTSQRRMGMVSLLSYGLAIDRGCAVGFLARGAISQPAAFGGSQRG
jgi:hypothetical protein